MPRDWKPRPAPKPTSITEICRRYYACALALSKVMGVPLTETFMQAYHSAISSTFIETSRCELRLPAGVTLPPLVPPNGQGAPARGVEPGDCRGGRGGQANDRS